MGAAGGYQQPYQKERGIRETVKAFNNSMPFLIILEIKENNFTAL